MKDASLCPLFFWKLIDIRISLQLGLFANPIYSSDGDYPDLVRKQVDKLSEAEGYYRSRLRKFTPEEILNIKGKHSDVNMQVRQEVQFSGCLTFTWGCSL
jgi:hypothetical protein